MRFWPVLVCASLFLLPPAQAAQVPDYAGLFETGTSFQEFLRLARTRREEWVRNYRKAHVEVATIARIRASGERRRLLVVTEDWCGDSANTIPYLAKLVDEVPDLLMLHVVSATEGRTVMEAHLTPDGRAATPTVIVLDEENRVRGTWVERPSALQKWFLEQQSMLGRNELYDKKYAWYADDQGQTTIAEIADLIRPKR